MNKLLTLALVFLLVLCATLAYAQFGTFRGGGSFPNGYRGAIFTGKLIKGEGDTITLEYTKGDKTQTFAGVFPKDGCGIPRADGAQKAAQPADLEVGTVLRAYYIEDSAKVNGEKKKFKSVVGLTLIEYKGKGVPIENQTFFPCPANSRLMNMAF